MVYVFRNPVVLVDGRCSGADNFRPFQDEIYEMVEQTPAGKERKPAREVGG